MYHVATLGISTLPVPTSASLAGFLQSQQVVTLIQKSRNCLWLHNLFILHLEQQGPERSSVGFQVTARPREVKCWVPGLTDP